MNSEITSHFSNPRARSWDSSRADRSRHAVGVVRRCVWRAVPGRQWAWRNPIQSAWRWLWVHVVVTVLAWTGAAWAAPIPEMIHYQGRITVGNQNFNQAGDFRFALVNHDGSQSFWSNDGTSTNGSEPTAAVSIEVDHGVFSVLLGDPALNMDPITPSVFAGDDVWLRVWFDDGVNGSEQLVPDQRIVSVGYAMMSAGVADGAITSDKIADGAVTSVKIATPAIHTTHLGDGVVTTLKLANGSVTTEKLAEGAVTGDKIAPNSITTDHIVNNTLTSADVADVLTLENLNLGGLNWDGSLRLFAKPNGGGGGILNPGGELRGLLDGDALGSSFSLLLNNGQTGVVVSSQSPGGRLTLRDAFGTMSAFLGTTVGGGDLNLFQIDGNPGIRLDGDRASYDSRGSAGGEISVHLAGGLVGLLLDGDHDSAGRIEVRQPDGTPYVDIFGRGAHEGGEIRIKDAAGVTAITLDGNGGDAGLAAGGLLQLGRTTGLNVVLDNNEITARNNGAEAPLYLNPNQGNVVIGRTTELTPSARLLVESDAGQDSLRVRVGTSTKLYVSGSGQVGINTTNVATGYELSVNGQVICEELVVQASGEWPDYVFAEDYELMSLEELESSIKQNRHLPGIPKAGRVQQEGISIGEMQKQMMEKIEELTLYIIAQNKQLKTQEAQIDELRAASRQAR